MPHRVLNEDWSEYDNKKKKGVDKNFFSCEEEWERDYLVRLIKKHKPNVSEQAIRNAIASCCQTIPGNKPRITFVTCVMGKL